MLRQLSLACIGFSLFCLPAQGFTITTGGSSTFNVTIPVTSQGQFSTVANVTTIDFNSGSAPTTGIAQYNAATANVVTGSVGGQYAAPPNDTSRYFSVGPSTAATATITFTQSINYFGFFAGSLDSFNSIEFFNGNGPTPIELLTGTQIAALGGFAASGNQTQGIYINIFASNSSEIFNRVRFSSNSNAFETDNHAYRIGNTANAPVPEPSPMLPALLTFGLGALLARIYKSRISLEKRLSIH
jgi:hypothetical protein